MKGMRSDLYSTGNASEDFKSLRLFFLDVSTTSFLKECLVHEKHQMTLLVSIAVPFVVLKEVKDLANQKGVKNKAKMLKTIWRDFPTCKYSGKCQNNTN